MNTGFKTFIRTSIVASLLLAPLSVHATEQSNIKDAWLDGKLDTVILLNSQLNPFKIESDVDDNVAILKGEVDSPIKKELATELALSIEGIEDVDNQLKVVDSESLTSKIITPVADTSITAVVKTRLLMSNDIDSSHIDVSTEDQNVLLEGTVSSEAERELAGLIAVNTFKVKDVDNNLEVIN